MDSIELGGRAHALSGPGAAKELGPDHGLTWRGDSSQRQAEKERSGFGVLPEEHPGSSVEAKPRCVSANEQNAFLGYRVRRVTLAQERIAFDFLERAGEQTNRI